MNPVNAMINAPEGMGQINTKNSIKEVNETNKNRIIDVVKRNNPLSRAEISRLLNLSKPAVSENVNKLLETGLIIELGPARNAAGRKATLLALNAGYAYLIGADIGNFKLRVALSDLSGDIKDKREELLVPDIESGELVALLDSSIEKILAGNKVPPEKLLALCIGIPGVYDERQKKNLFVPYIRGFEDFDLAAHYKARYAGLCIINNNINLAALGEKRARADKENDYKNMVYINMGIGIGAGIILNGELFTGLNGTAGEIAYGCFGDMPVKKKFTKEGTFEHAVSTRRLIINYNSASGNRLPLNSIDSMLYILRRHEHGEPAARGVIDELLYNIKLLLINVTAFYAPDIIIFGGGLGEEISVYFPEIRKVLANNVPYPPDLSLAKCGPYSGIYGAIAEAKRIATADYRTVCGIINRGFFNVYTAASG